jgi:hypothetical protein
VQVKLETVGRAEQGLLAEARVEARSQLGLLTNHGDAVLEHLDRSTEVVPGNKHVDVRKYTPRWFRVNAARECNAFEHAGFDARLAEAFERAEEEMLESQRMRQPLPKTELELVALASSQREVSAASRGTKKPEEAVLLTLIEQPRELVVGKEVVRQPGCTGEPVPGDSAEDRVG